MKKCLLLIGVIISIAIQASPSKNDVYMTIYRKGHVEKSTTVHPSPMLLPIDVCYNNEKQFYCNKFRYIREFY